MQTVILSGNNKEILNLELSDILKLILDGGNFQWKILWINGISKNDNNFDMLTFEKKIKNEGLKLSFNELKKLSLKLDQLVEFVLIGKEGNINDIDVTESDSFIKNKCDFFIELIDSSYWEITMTKENLITVSR